MFRVIGFGVLGSDQFMCRKHVKSPLILIPKTAVCGVGGTHQSRLLTPHITLRPVASSQTATSIHSRCEGWRCAWIKPGKKAQHDRIEEDFGDCCCTLSKNYQDSHRHAHSCVTLKQKLSRQSQTRTQLCHINGTGTSRGLARTKGKPESAAALPGRRVNRNQPRPCQDKG